MPPLCATCATRLDQLKPLPPLPEPKMVRLHQLSATDLIKWMFQNQTNPVALRMFRRLYQLTFFLLRAVYRPPTELIDGIIIRETSMHLLVPLILGGKLDNEYKEMVEIRRQIYNRFAGDDTRLTYDEKYNIKNVKLAVSPMPNIYET